MPQHQNSVGKEKVKIKYDWISELWKIFVGSFEKVAFSELRVESELGGIFTIISGNNL